MNAVLIGVSIYIAVQLAIGIAVSRRMKTESDYYLAGRKLGPMVVTMSVFATWFGAETCMGSPGAIYEEGLAGGRADPFGYSICLLVMGLVFAVPLYRRKLTTLGDLYRQRYGGGVEKVAVLVIVPSSIIWAGAQIRAFGQVISASSTLDSSFTIFIAAVVVVIYTSTGGLLADAITDVVQGAALIIGLFIILGAAVWQLGGVSDTLASIEPVRLNMIGEGESLLGRLDTWAVPIFGSVLAQELISRTLAARSERVAKYSVLAASGVYFFVGMVPAMIALVGPALLPNMDDPEQFLPTVAQQLLPTVLYILFAGALISAILSTVDSALLAAASLLAHNIIVPTVGGLTERAKVVVARTCVVGFGVIAYFFAIRESTVYEQVEEASAFGSAGILIVAIFALFTSFGGKWSAMLTLVAGSAVWLYASMFLEMDYPYIVALVASLMVYTICGLVEHSIAPQETPESA